VATKPVSEKQKTKGINAGTRQMPNERHLKGSFLMPFSWHITHMEDKPQETDFISVE